MLYTELTSSGQIEEFSGNIESIPVAGHNYSLTCKVVSDCHCPMTTQWTKKGNPQFMRNTTFVSFTPLSLSDAGRYTCRVSLGCVRNMLIAQKDINIKSECMCYNIICYIVIMMNNLNARRSSVSNSIFFD